MIDMSKLYEHEDYAEALDSFQSREDLNSCDYTHWGLFKDVHLKVAKDRCPICECDFQEEITRDSNNGTTTIKPTIDHFRPKEHYPFLKCNHENYLLMCSECNNIYKGSEFPIHNNESRARNESEVIDEEYLIVNPITDNILDLFILVFKRTTTGKSILELHPKEESGYKHEKALETIKLFGLGDCETNRHSNDNVYNCRIAILESHYGIFIEFVNALIDGNKQKTALELRDNRDKFERYGFFDFIKKGQFKVL